MTQAREMIAIGGAGRYRMIEVDVPRTMAIARSITPEWLLSTLEEFHRDGWEVCGYQLVPGNRSGEMGLWVTYRRTRPDA